MRVIEVDGVPVLLTRKDIIPKYMFKVRKKKTKLEEMPAYKLKPHHKKAMQLYVESGCDPSKKTEIGKAVGYHPASAKRALDKLTKRKKIVKILDKKAPDVKIGNELARLAFESTHPLSKEDNPDNTNRLGALREINRIKDNYPPKQVQIDERAVHVHFTPGDHQAYQEYVTLSEEEVEVSQD